MRREATELRASRERLALSNDADRRSFERALHDGLQQRLVGLDMGIALVAGAIGVDAAEAERLIEELGRDVREALDETRRLAERIYPPLLDTGGLGVALRTAAAGADVPVQIDVVASAPYPPAIAGAVYFCCLDVLEAVSAGTPVAISVNDEAGRLTFDIAADGHVDIEELPLRDRIEALGGRLTIEGSGDETRAVGSLPLSGGG